MLFHIGPPQERMLILLVARFGLFHQQLDAIETLKAFPEEKTVREKRSHKYHHGYRTAKPLRAE